MAISRGFTKLSHIRETFLRNTRSQIEAGPKIVTVTLREAGLGQEEIGRDEIVMQLMRVLKAMTTELDRVLL